MVVNISPKFVNGPDNSIDQQSIPEQQQQHQQQPMVFSPPSSVKPPDAQETPLTEDLFSKGLIIVKKK
jgi:hypothetical protein